MFESEYGIVPLRPLLARFLHSIYQIVEVHSIKGKNLASSNKLKSKSKKSNQNLYYSQLLEFLWKCIRNVALNVVVAQIPILESDMIS